MAVPLRPTDEDARLLALDRQALPDVGADSCLNDLVRLAAQVCDAPIALVSIVGESQQWALASHGIVWPETPRHESICAWAMLAPPPFVVEDTHLNPLFASLPSVVGATGVRSYAGVPLLTERGGPLGTLCIMARNPRGLTAEQATAMTTLANQVMARLDLRRHRDEMASRDGRLIEAFRACPVALSIHTWKDRTFVEVNDAFTKLLGWEPDELIGRTTDEIGLVSTGVARGLRDQLVSGGALRDVEIDVTAKDGQSRRVLVGGAVMVINEHRHVVTTFVDITDRTTAERALSEHMNRLSAVIETEPECVKVVSPEGALLEMNPAGLAMLEAESLAEVRSQPLINYLLPDYRPAFTELHAQVLGGSHGSMTFEVQGLRGGQKWLEMHAAPLRGPDGRVNGLLSITRDITERRNAEARVRHLNRVFAMHSEINQSIVRTQDVTTLLTQACQTAVERGGFRMAWIGVDDGTGRLAVRAQSGAAPSQMALVERLLESTPPSTGCAFTHYALERGQPGVCQDIACEPDDSAWRDEVLSWGFRSMASLPLARNGRTFATFNLYADEPGFFNEDEINTLNELSADLSFAVESYERQEQRLRAEAERNAAEERFRQLAENIRDVFWILEPATQQMLYVSPAFAAIWQRPCGTPQECRQHWIDAVHPDDRDQVRDAMDGPLLEGRYAETYRILRPDGSVRWIRDRAFPILDADGTIHRVVGTAEDVTGPHDLEEQFRQSQKMETVGRLAGGIAHDFNNLLTVVRGLADLALVGTQATGSLRTDLQQIRDAGDRAAALTSQLLAMSRRQVLHPRVVNLNDTVEGMRDILTRLIGEDVHLVVRPEPALSFVKVDPGQIEQVLLNLAVNARDAMPQGGTLTIETRHLGALPPDGAPGTGETGQRVALIVNDTGVGMDEDTRRKIFEPFFTTKALRDGTGLGLSTVHGIVTQSGGSIEVESAPDRGSTFRIMLPIESRDPEPPDAAGQPAGTSLLGSEIILVVEDERALRSLIRRVLEASGYTVVEAPSGSEALRIAAGLDGPLHLLLSDVVMPGLNAFEMTDRLLTTRPTMKIIYMSGYSEDAIKRQGAMQTGSSFLIKPFSPDDLRRTIRSTLDG